MLYQMRNCWQEELIAPPHPNDDSWAPENNQPWDNPTELVLPDARLADCVA